ncbi:MAG: hypothetical protein K0S41_4195, partial [Anaerocolumna sp.]|nr:hypothetical protein [Anaerocolumna sp.]
MEDTTRVNNSKTNIGVISNVVDNEKVDSNVDYKNNDLNNEINKIENYKNDSKDIEITEIEKNEINDNVKSKNFISKLLM